MRLILFLMLIFSCSFLIAREKQYYQCNINIAAAELQLRSGDQVAPDNPVNCDCEGTGTSGDGLGPCVCGESCKCKASAPGLKTRIDNILQESFPLVVPVIEEQTEENRLDTFERLLQRIDKRLGKVEETIANMKEVQEKFAVPERQLLYFYTENCPGCNQVELEFNKLRTAGWKIDGTDSAHIKKVFNGGAEFGVSSYPAFVEIINGVPQKPVFGFRNMHEIGKMRLGK